MNKKGFYIKSIIATGPGMKTSRVDFSDGCNLLFGPSDTGKSSVFSIINFMLGGDKEPKKVSESLGYDTYYMELVTYEDNKVHTICKKIGTTNWIVKECPFEYYATTNISCAYPPRGKKKTYSEFLLELNGYENDIMIRTTANDKGKLTYGKVRSLILVSEDRIISEKPIFLPINDNTTKTSEKSVMYYLTTGEDDSAFKESEKEDIRKSRIGGMISLTEESIKEVKDKIQELGDVSFADFKGDEFYNIQKKEVEKQEAVLNTLYRRKSLLEDRIREIRSSILFTREFIKRMELLKRHYTLDIERYEHLYEGASLLAQLDDNHLCPLCHSHINDSVSIDETYKAALKDEYEKTKVKLVDVSNVILRKQVNLRQLEVDLSNIDGQLSASSKEINEFSPHLSLLKETLVRYQENIEKKTLSVLLNSELQRLSEKLGELKNEQSAKPSAPNYNREVVIGADFCTKVKNMLLDWYILKDTEEVVYDDKEFDFKIGNNARVDCGKGTRGVTCTAIMMALLENCHDHNIPFSHLLVVDSPLTAHFNDGYENASDITQSQFYKYCNDNKFDYQLILIDNKCPKEEERSQMNNIHFIEFSKRDRKGFYLGKETSE